jgi:hypothetical protein
MNAKWEEYNILVRKPEMKRHSRNLAEDGKIILKES